MRRISLWQSRFAVSNLALLLLLIPILATGCSGSRSAKGKPRDKKANVKTAAEVQLETDLQVAPAYTHQDHFAILQINVQRILTQPELGEFEWDKILASWTTSIGGLFESTDELSELTFLLDEAYFSLVGFSGDSDAPSPVVSVVESTKPLEQDRIAGDFNPVEDQENTWLSSDEKIMIWFIDEYTIAYGSPETIQKLNVIHPLNAKLMNSGRLKSSAAIRGNFVVAPIRGTIKSMMGPAMGLSPEIGEALRFVNSTQRFEFSMDLADKNLGHMTFVMIDKKMADELKDKIAEGAQMMAEGAGNMASMTAEIQGEMGGQSKQLEIWPAVMKEITESGLTISKNLPTQVSVSVRRPSNFDKLLSAMIDDAKVQLELAQRKDHASSIASAMLAYEKENGQFPSPNWTADDSSQEFSWRVSLLPGLGYQELYDQFKFDEPWDSEHNLSVAATVPIEFNARFELIGGKLGPFGGESLKLADVTDDHDQTLMFAETRKDDTYQWHQPSSVVYDSDEAELPSLGRSEMSGILAAMFDGQVLTLSRSSESGLRAVLTHNGGDRTGRKIFQ